MGMKVHIERPCAISPPRRPASARRWVRRCQAIGLVCLLISSSAHAEQQQVAVLPSPPMWSFRVATVPRDPSLLCRDAIQMVEFKYRLPPGLLAAIALVETAHPDAITHKLEPWPWSVQAENQSLFFNSKADAVRWVKQALTTGIRSIDTGCLQVNLLFHPTAFHTIEQAFDPMSNADYAARFLQRLHAATGDWKRASGFYHSETPLLAATYRQRLKQFTDLSKIAARSTMLSMLRQAWLATAKTDETLPCRPTSVRWHQRDLASADLAPTPYTPVWPQCP
jgi:hypothetical protein